MANMDLETTEVPTIIISSDSEEDSSSSPVEESTSSPSNETEKEESPEPPATPRPSIFNSAKSFKKKKSCSSGKRKAKRVPCYVCNARFGSQANLDAHMKLHWDDFDKMEALLHRITNKILDHDQIQANCDCPRCRYKLSGHEKPHEMEQTNRFCCQICDLTFFTANKLSKHMDKHRTSYYKMKELENSNHVLFFDRPVPIKVGE